MTICWIEGFENSNTKEALDIRYTSFGGGWDAITGRNGGTAIKGNHTDSGSAAYARLDDFVGSTSGGVFAAGIMLDNFRDGLPLITIADWPTGYQLSVVVKHVNSGQFQLELRRGDNSGTILGTDSTLLPYREWLHLEFKFTISNSTGSTELRINGAALPALTLSGIDTQQTANNSWNGFFFHSYADTAVVGSGTAWDDIYIQNSNGTWDFLGDYIVEGTYPESDHSNGSWASVGAEAPVDAVDDASLGTSDKDSSYISSSTPGNAVTFSFRPLQRIGQSIQGIQFHADVRKQGISNEDVKFLLVDDVAANYYSPVISVTRAAYWNIAAVWEQCPQGGGRAWDPSDFQSWYFGLED